MFIEACLFVIIGNKTFDIFVIFVKNKHVMIETFAIVIKLQAI